MKNSTKTTYKMDRKEFAELNDAAVKGTISDEMNPIFIFESSLPTELLSMIAKGQIDVVELAKRQLENRGLNLNGKFVGFYETID